MKRILTFGEILLRLKSPENQRILQSKSFEAAYGGAEANVATSLSILGDAASFVTKLPNNVLGDTAFNTLRQFGVDTQYVLRGGPRLGIYFFEKGASIRTTNVIYDRFESSFATSKAIEYHWHTLLKDIDYFYFSGITPAISTELRTTLLSACRYCQAHNITVICDLNYRGKLWTSSQAQKVMSKFMEYVNVCIANDEDFEATLGIKAFNGDMKHGIDQAESFEMGMREVIRRYPNCHTVASILRNIASVEDSKWTGLLLHRNKIYRTPIYSLHVLEGVASGDAFGAGLIHSIVNGFSQQEQINYAIAASVLKLTISGDLNLVSDTEIRNVMNTDSPTRVQR